MLRSARRSRPRRDVKARGSRSGTREAVLAARARREGDGVDARRRSVRRAPARTSNAPSPRLDGAELMDSYQTILTAIIALELSAVVARRHGRPVARGRISPRCAKGAIRRASARYRLRATASDREIAAAHRTRQAHKDALDAFLRRRLGCDPDADLAWCRPSRIDQRAAACTSACSMSTARRCPIWTCSTGFRSATALHAPALAVQAGQTAQGLPVGVQLVGPWHGEDRLFDFAAAVEEGLGGFKPPPGV